MEKKIVPEEVPLKKKKKTYQVHLFIALCIVIFLYIKEVNTKMEELEACEKNDNDNDNGKKILGQLDEILKIFSGN